MIPPHPSQILPQKYRVERDLGKGGMGRVVEVTDTKSWDRFAIKLIGYTDKLTQREIARFKREARAAMKLRSVHIVQVHDVDEAKDGTPYIKMEYLEGRDLGDRLLDEDGVLPVRDAVDYMLQTCEAIAEAHGRGIIHRDLKPSNLFLNHQSDGTTCIKVLDFGLAKMLDGRSLAGFASRTTKPDSEDSMSSEVDASEAMPMDVGRRGPLTQAKRTLGTHGYMSPEQFASARDVDERTDLWSLGIILHEIMTGKNPFNDGSINWEKTVPNRSPILADLPNGARLPSGLADAVLRCLKKDPNDRFPNVHEFARAIYKFGSKEASESLARISAFTAYRAPGTRTQRTKIATARMILLQIALHYSHHQAENRTVTRIQPVTVTASMECRNRESGATIDGKAMAVSLWQDDCALAHPDIAWNHQVTLTTWGLVLKYAGSTLVQSWVVHPNMSLMLPDHASLFAGYSTQEGAVAAYTTSNPTGPTPGEPSPQPVPEVSHAIRGLIPEMSKRTFIFPGPQSGRVARGPDGTYQVTLKTIHTSQKYAGVCWEWPRNVDVSTARGILLSLRADTNTKGTYQLKFESGDVRAPSVLKRSFPQFSSFATDQVSTEELEPTVLRTLRRICIAIDQGDGDHPDASFALRHVVLE